MSRHFRRMASGGHFSERRNLSVPRIYLLRNLKNDQSDGSAASLVKGFVSRHLRNPKVHSHHPAASRADTSNSHRRQASEITKSANQRYPIRFCVIRGFWFPCRVIRSGAFAANTRIPAQAAGIESRGMLTPAACRPHGVHSLPERERRPPSPGAGSRPDALPPSAQRTPSEETPAMPSDLRVFGVLALRGTVTRPGAFRPSARVSEHLAGIACCPLSFRLL